MQLLIKPLKKPSRSAVSDSAKFVRFALQTCDSLVQKVWLNASNAEREGFTAVSLQFVWLCSTRFCSTCPTVCFSAKTAFILLFLLFPSGRILSTAFSLIRLQQLIPFTATLCHSNSESLCPLSKGRGVSSHFHVSAVVSLLWSGRLSPCVINTSRPANYTVFQN